MVWVGDVGEVPDQPPLERTDLLVDGGEHALYVSTATLSEQLQQALDSRPIIEQAKGILMGERRCIAEEAFEVLAEISQHANRKLRDVATALVEQAHPSPDIRGAK